ncbi:MAG: V-type ATP synthase subunit I [Candidatus Thiodiazotropha sp.]
MSIVRLKKITLFGLPSDKTDVLEQLQSLGCLHLRSLAPPPREPENAVSDQPLDAYKALRYLQGVKKKRRVIRHEAEFDMDRVVAKVLQNKQRVRDAEDRSDALRERIEALRPWGNFDHIPPHLLGGMRLWFYILPVDKLAELDDLREPWQVVHRDNRFLYLAVIAANEPHDSLLSVPRIHTGSLPLEEVIRQWEASEIVLEELLAERQALTRWIHLLATRLGAAEDRASRDHAASKTLDDPDLFALHAWAPVAELPRLEALARKQGLALLVEDPTADEAPPTLLDNPPRMAAGQDLVDFYQTPGYRSWDPSRVVFLSFTLFFAMILSDAGYAFLLSLGLLAGWRKMGRSDTGRRLRILIATLCGGALVWGVMMGSYFGATPPAGSLGDRLKLLDINDFDSMMRLSVVIGVLHVALANAIMAWQNRGTNRAWTSLGWIGAVVGGLLIWLGLGDSPAAQLSHTLGVVSLVAGLSSVFLFASERPVNHALGLLWRVLDGLAALTNVTKLFGDVLSYLRLFALGLASASLALTFNDLANQVAAAHTGLGLFFSLLILLVGHLLNILLSLMSGVVHGLRLNFIEFYNWGLSEEGYPFRAFAKKGVKE